ncbi:MAG TPA: hypothetical protein VGQ83_41215 [Polyangia bacterium]|jgi:hypothetical protein
MSDVPHPDRAATGEPPQDPDEVALGAAVAAFKAGDFAATRRRLTALRARELPAGLRAQVDELWRRTGADPVALWTAVGSVVLFLVIIYLTYWR